MKLRQYFVEFFRSAKFPVLVIFSGALLCGWSAFVHSPTDLEARQLPAGLSHLAFDDYSLCSVNPPLIRTVAAVPVWLLSPRTDWRNFTGLPGRREEFAVGKDFLNANGTESFWLFTIGRWACLPFFILGGWSCASWAYDLYGCESRSIAALLWTFSPLCLGHGSLLTTDAHAAALGLFATYVFWSWLKSPTWTLTIFAGMSLGFAELSKFTLLTLYPLFIFFWAVRYLRHPYQRESISSVRMLAVIFLISVVVINSGYNFKGIFTRLSNFQFSSQLLMGKKSETVGQLGNRFSSSYLGQIPVPFPKSFVEGIDLQKRDFEQGIRSYMRGEWKDSGWSYFYVYALGVKLPVGTMILMVFAIFIRLPFRNSNQKWFDEFVVMLPAVTILAFVSFQTGFSLHARYVILILPFLFIWISKIGSYLRSRSRFVVLVILLPLVWSVGSSLQVYPHSISYFNEIAGGPSKGYQHLVDSNVAWGQDLVYLKKWLNKHPEAKPLRFAPFGMVDPRHAGIDFQLPPVGPNQRVQLIGHRESEVGPLPGWFAIDVNHLAGSYGFIYDGAEQKLLASRIMNYEYFREFKPVDRIGYSIFIYHISLKEANRVRELLGLGDLSEL